MTKRPQDLVILGGGPAGLAAAFYARRAGLPCVLLEARSQVGGNAITLRHGEFRYDSGAHRFHDVDPEVTADVKALLGDDLRKIHVGSQIFHRGRFLDFPLSPLNLLRGLGPITCARAAAELARARIASSPRRSFHDFAVYTYGDTIAERFLLGYCEKLWGLPASELSPAISGKRMKGLDLKTFVIEALFGRRSKTEHLDGAFYYPRHGYGQIAEALADGCDADTIRVGERITRVQHRDGMITAVETNHTQTQDAGHVVSTLPMSLLVQLLDPPPPAPVLAKAKKLRFRNLILVAMFIDTPSLGDNGSIYFPDANVDITRVYEPRNRSSDMSPPGKTSLVAELPCQHGDAIWQRSDEQLVSELRRLFGDLGWVCDETFLGAEVTRLSHAYPVLELGFEDAVGAVSDYLSGFENLSLSGRSGTFQYSHVHDQIRIGRDIIAALGEHAAPAAASPATGTAPGC